MHTLEILIAASKVRCCIILSYASGKISDIFYQMNNQTAFIHYQLKLYRKYVKLNYFQIFIIQTLDDLKTAVPKLTAPKLHLKLFQLRITRKHQTERSSKDHSSCIRATTDACHVVLFSLQIKNVEGHNLSSSAPNQKLKHSSYWADNLPKQFKIIITPYCSFPSAAI